MKTLLTVAALAIAAATFSYSAPAAAEPALRLCTGKKDGNYWLSGGDIREQAKGRVSVLVEDSKGSVDCLDRLSAGTVDAAIVQSDAFLTVANRLNLERAGELYTEVVHLLCNKDLGLSKITKLNKNTVVAIGPAGTGTQVTWQGFVKVDPDRYRDVPTKPMDGERALAKAAEGTDVQCVLYVAGLNSGFMQDKAARYSDKLVLVPTDDSDMKDVKDAKGRQVYNYVTIPSGIYKNNSGWFNGIDSIGVKAILVVNEHWADENGDAYDSLLKAVNLAGPTIRQRVGQ